MRAIFYINIDKHEETECDDCLFNVSTSSRIHKGFSTLA